MLKENEVFIINNSKVIINGVEFPEIIAIWNENNRVLANIDICKSNFKNVEIKGLRKYKLIDYTGYIRPNLIEYEYVINFPIKKENYHFLYNQKEYETLLIKREFKEKINK